MYIFSQSYASFLCKALKWLSGFGTMLTNTVSISSRLLSSICPSLAIFLLDISLCFLLTEAEPKIFSHWILGSLSQEIPLYTNFFSDVFLLPCAPSSIFTSEFLIYDSTVVKFRIRTLQPTGRENLMKMWNIYKTAFIISLHGDTATFFERNCNTENVETFIVLAHLLPTQSSLNFG